jgi:curli production assembly/transport component CsgG
VQFSPGKTIGFRSTLSFNQLFKDGIDGQVFGLRNDYYLRGTVGLVFHIGHFPRKRLSPIAKKPVAAPKAAAIPNPATPGQPAVPQR